MADVMLVLLIIFMITTPMLQNQITLNLPKSGNGVEDKPAEPVTLSLTRDGRIYLGRAQVTEQKMAEALSESLAGGVDKNVFIRADQALAYGDVVRIVNECRRLGAQRVGLMTDKETH